MDILKGQQVIEFSRTFQTELDCKKFLAELKYYYKLVVHFNEKNLKKITTRHVM
jgi:hypothetical protein